MTAASEEGWGGADINRSWAAEAQRVARFGGGACLLGGVLRMASSVIEYDPASLRLEALYAVIDLALLFGLLGLYAHAAPGLGRLGRFGLCAALAGVASILGPDADRFGVNWYVAGGAVFLLGLLLFSVALLRRTSARAAPLIWLSACLAAASSAMGGGAAAFVAAGLLLGAGFVVAGAQLLQASGRGEAQSAAERRSPGAV